ncbi:MAG: SxtJ family membrane protein [Proteobacteria bacterium]|nr:SxtJ family membrane protein [Pseudomonadota bacterium]
MPKSQAFHEDFAREDGPKVGSERSFGIVFAVVFAIIGLAPLWDGSPYRLWALIVAAAFLAAGMVAPVVLRPLNKIWFLFGMALHKVMNPLIMGLLFYLTVTPIALIMRMVGKDPLNRRFDPDAKSYWVVREPAGPAPETMRQQF